MLLATSFTGTSYNFRCFYSANHATSPLVECPWWTCRDKVCSVVSCHNFFYHVSCRHDIPQWAWSQIILQCELLVWIMCVLVEQISILQAIMAASSKLIYPHPLIKFLWNIYIERGRSQLSCYVNWLTHESVTSWGYIIIASFVIWVGDSFCWQCVQVLSPWIPSLIPRWFFTLQGLRI